MLKKDERGLIPMLLLLVILIAIVIGYSYLRIRAKQHGLQLPK
ncbi:MAG TPA: hypothetical protein VFK11_02945 [Candidatus Saccharimonadales bacterium]|nr:hypothetical protein [Candidatus Saccharimonadales bacterium]